MKTSSRVLVDSSQQSQFTLAILHRRAPHLFNIPSPPSPRARSKYCRTSRDVVANNSVGECQWQRPSTSYAIVVPSLQLIPPVPLRPTPLKVSYTPASIASGTESVFRLPEPPANDPSESESASALGDSLSSLSERERERLSTSVRGNVGPDLLSVEKVQKCERAAHRARSSSIGAC